MSRGVRVAIAGAGFIGAVHARSARLAGASLVGVAASTPESAAAPPPRSVPSARSTSAEELVARAGRRRRPHLHAQPSARPARRAGARGRQARDLREADRARRRRRPARSPTPPRPPGGSPPCPSSTATTRPCARRASACARARRGPVRLLHGSYLQDWLLRPEDDNWRVDAELGGASRAFADIGSHWCDLAEFVSGHRITRLSARTLTAVPERFASEAHAAFQSVNGHGAARPVTTEDAALVQFETDGGAIGSTVISQISAGRKNRLWLEVDGGEEALVFNQEEPESLWVGRREAATLIKRDAEALSPAGRALRDDPGGPPAGLQRLLRRLRGRDLRRDRTGRARRRPAGVRRRPARRAPHGRRARVRARGALGRRGSGAVRASS